MIESFVLAIAALSGCWCDTVPAFVGEIEVRNPACVSLYAYPGYNSGYDLLISTSSGNPFEKDVVYRVSHIEEYMKNNATNFTLEVLSDSIYWPNQLSGVSKVFGNRTVAVASGNFAPKNRGGVSLINLDKGAPYITDVITDGDDEWFYHRLAWMDMDIDLDKDVVTCRAHRPLFGYAKGQLVWLENQGNLNQSTPWKSHVIAEGPDVNFVSSRLQSTDGWMDAFFAAQYFNPGLRVFWVNESGDWNETKVNSRDIDMTIGPVFDVVISDVNGDFESDLLVTAHSATNGTVWAYEIPDDFRTGEYKRHLLASGFMSSSVHQGKGAPGSARPISHGTASGKDPIILSGDDSGQAYVLNARSNAKDDWSYTVTPFLDAGTGNVGGIDFAGGVYSYNSYDIFVPAKNKNKVYIYRLMEN